MFRPLLLTRASIGLAATAVEQTLALPGKTLDALVALPTVPVKLAGGVVQSYLHAGQTFTELAVKGDRVIEAVFPARSDKPEWATFDEDETEGGEPLEVSYEVYGATGGSGSGRAGSGRAGSGGAGSGRAGSDGEGTVASGRVARRRA